MSFEEFVARRHAAGELVVQPRMGFADPAAMRAGLAATRSAAAATVGTVTLDSYTRVCDTASVAHALRNGIALNGYPIVNHPADVTRAMLDGLEGPEFPVQVRHGSARPADIFRAMIAAGLHATEGGPVSYCLPYSRTPLDESVRNWAHCCDLLLDAEHPAGRPHLETFGGCMMGQLCPPSELVALSVLEALFFYRRGVRSISVSYAQQTNMTQDQEAVSALRRLCAELLPEATWHVVIYAYMGLFPRTSDGARGLLGTAAELAVSTGSERLIVKTTAEAHRIPTVAENVAALEHAGAVARSVTGKATVDRDNQVYREAYALVDAVLNSHADLGRAIVVAFKRGLLDVPYCLHPDNAGQARSYLDPTGRLGWSELGSLPLRRVVESHHADRITSSTLMSALSHIQNVYDAEALEQPMRAIGGES
ncbi:Similar to glutamate mutase subumit E [Amycolatopsis camponoti]|uniref:Similar to glutamate mutase subumit E n=1 Tax=Amycolatopsis camponoti TaxID=2606593 RepID=A0A6I8LRN4_9PSEU|nr:methylaspartate mutase [Amycolatopsis camponoti]VVJ19503.1 Similar to glutamate mutase subumit E [Amycolatopsis camponoti]